jgi:hypothetical protein
MSASPNDTQPSRASPIMIAPRHISAEDTSAPAGSEVTARGSMPLAKLVDDSETRVFDKTLPSDITQEEAVALLQRLDEKTSLFRGQS